MDYVLAIPRFMWWVWRMIGTLLFGIGTAIVYRDLDHLLEIRPTRKTFSIGKFPIDAAWLSGESVLRHLIPKKHGIRRLILPHPASPNLAEFERATGQEFDYPSTIVQMTRRARDLGIKVAWYPVFAGMSFSIGKRWVHLEPQPPCSVETRYPIIRLGMSNRSVRKHYRTVFDEMWRDCPKEDDGETPRIDHEYMMASPMEVLALIEQQPPGPKRTPLGVGWENDCLGALPRLTRQRLNECYEEIAQAMVAPDARPENHTKAHTPSDTPSYMFLAPYIECTHKELNQKIAEDWHMPRHGGGSYTGRVSRGKLLQQWILTHGQRIADQAVNS